MRVTAPDTGGSVSAGQTVHVRVAVIDDSLGAGVDLALLLNEVRVQRTSVRSGSGPATNAAELNQTAYIFDVPITAEQVGRTLRFRVQALDAHGLSSQSQEVRVLVREDQPPGVAVTNPTAGARLVSGQIIELRADATDDVGVTRVDFYVDDRLVGSDRSAPFSYNYLSVQGVVTEQVLRIAASAVDASGHETRSAQVSVTLGRDEQPPVVNIAAPALTRTEGGQELADVVESNRIVVRVTGYDNVGVERLTLRGIRAQGGAYVLTGNAADVLTAPDFVPEQIPGAVHAFSAFRLVRTPAFSNTQGVPADHYPISVSATDGIGNVSTNEIVIAVGPDRPPEIGVVRSNRSVYLPRDAVELAVQALDDIAVAQIEARFFVDGASSAATTQTRTVTPQARNTQQSFTLQLATLGLSNADHTVEAVLVAIDDKGHRSDQIDGGARHQTLTVHADTAAPLAAIFTPIPGVDIVPRREHAILVARGRRLAAVAAARAGRRRDGLLDRALGRDPDRHVHVRAARQRRPDHVHPDRDRSVPATTQSPSGATR